MELPFEEGYTLGMSPPNFAINGSLDNDTLLGNTTFCKTIDQTTLLLFTQMLYAIVCIVGLFGNSLVIYVVLRFSKMQTVTNMYIVNLAVADECFLIGIPFLIATMSLQLWPFGKIICKFYMTTTSINQFTSSIFLTIMSADRYVAVGHPISAPKMRTPFISKETTAWTASALLMIPIFMYASLMNDGQVNMSCNILWPESENLSGQTAFTLYSFVLGFALPLLLIFCFYVMVIRKLKTVGPKNKSKEKKKSHRKVTKLVLTVITVYVCCWLPYWITQMSLIFTEPNKCQSRFVVTVFLLTGILCYSNSAMNPILYAFLSDNFKKSFLKACTCAAGKDVNATLHMENSVFPRRGHHRASERGGARGGNRSGGIAQGGNNSTAAILSHAHDDRGPLVTSAATTATSSGATAATSAATTTDLVSVTTDNHSKDTLKNGVKVSITVEL
ncbi:hypothetical protein LSTR_LSTR010403 [Laodelphax striatellus]|uniref:G-protein coupled receptors family 1 profile domain-containing protein n=1 Tax=Laodelphax striatellus TaxID=195883 RepID=A0A482WSX1_LAOST|nr:hypothetical protein LSTR_LSTR010403 [Laodelphax striatellus]